MRANGMNFWKDLDKCPGKKYTISWKKGLVTLSRHLLWVTKPHLENHCSECSAAHVLDMPVVMFLTLLD